MVLASRSCQMDSDPPLCVRPQSAECPHSVRVWKPLAAAALVARTVHGCAQPLSSVWHAAGVLADGLSMMMTAAPLRSVYAPKAHGALSLHAATATDRTAAFTLFSSITALLGGAGQERAGGEAMTGKWTRQGTVAARRWGCILNPIATRTTT